MGTIGQDPSVSKANWITCWYLSIFVYYCKVLFMIDSSRSQRFALNFELELVIFQTQLAHLWVAVGSPHWYLVGYKENIHMIVGIINRVLYYWVQDVIGVTFFWQWTTLVYLSTNLKRKRKRLFCAFHSTLRCYRIKNQPLLFLSCIFPLWILNFSYEMYLKIRESVRLMGLKIHQDSAQCTWLMNILNYKW